MGADRSANGERTDDQRRDTREATELLVDAIEFAHAAYERQLAARAAVERLTTRHRVSLQDLASELGISVDAVENLLDAMPMPIPVRLRMDEESVDSLMRVVAKRRRWDERPPGTYLDRLHLDSVILRALLTRAPVAFAILDVDLRYVLVNEALADINGVPVEDHIGKTLAEVVPDLASEATEAFQRVLGSGEPLLNYELTGTVRSAPGIVRKWHESVYRLTDNRGILGLAVVAIEMS